MTDATVPILGGGTTSAPQDYRVKGGQVLGLMAVRATFDGTAAAAFLPCVQIISSAGNVMAQTVGSSVAAGASADVTFAPFLEAAETTPFGSGWQFDTYPQDGGYGYVETDTGIDAGTMASIDAEFPTLAASFGIVSAGLLFVDKSGSGLVLFSPTGQVNIASSGDNINIKSSFDIRQIADGAILVQAGSGSLLLQSTNSGDVAINPDRYLTVANLPVIDPGVSGAVWNNANVLTVSP